MATSYANSGGTGDRTALILVTSAKAAVPSGAGTWDNLVDGAISGTSGNALWNNNDSGHILYFDFRPTGFLQIIDEFKWYQDTTTTIGNYDLHGWDGSTWTALKSNFTLGGATPFQTVTVTNSTAYLVYRLTQVSGTWSSTPWCEEIEFKILAGAAVASSTSYSNTGGTGDRQATITATTTITLTTGTAPLLVDGTTGVQQVVFTGGQTGKEIKFNFGSAKIIDSFKWYQGTTSSHGTWILTGSNDDSTYVDLGTPFVFDGTASFVAKEFTQAAYNAVGYQYYKLKQLYSTTSGTPGIAEIEFKITASSLAAVAAQTVTDFTSAETAAAIVAAVAAQTVAAFSNGATGAGTDSVVAAQSLPAFSQAATGIHAPTGVAASQIVNDFTVSHPRMGNVIHGRVALDRDNVSAGARPRRVR